MLLERDRKVWVDLYQDVTLRAKKLWRRMQILFTALLFFFDALYDALFSQTAGEMQNLCLGCSTLDSRQGSLCNGMLPHEKKMVPPPQKGRRLNSDPTCSLPEHILAERNTPSCEGPNPRRADGPNCQTCLV